MDIEANQETQLNPTSGEPNNNKDGTTTGPMSAQNGGVGGAFGQALTPGPYEKSEFAEYFYQLSFIIFISQTCFLDLFALVLASKNDHSLLHHIYMPLTFVFINVLVIVLILLQQMRHLVMYTLIYLISRFYMYYYLSLNYPIYECAKFIAIEIVCLLFMYYFHGRLTPAELFKHYRRLVLGLVKRVIKWREEELIEEEQNKKFVVKAQKGIKDSIVSVKFSIVFAVLFNMFMLAVNYLLRLNLARKYIYFTTFENVYFVVLFLIIRQKFDNYKPYLILNMISLIMASSTWLMAYEFSYTSIEHMTISYCTLCVVFIYRKMEKRQAETACIEIVNVNYVVPEDL